TASTLWQLTTAWNVGTGLVPWRLPGTGSACARTNPRTLTVSLPSTRNSACADEMIHGNPPPGRVRIGFGAPTYGPDTAAIVSNPSATGAISGAAAWAKMRGAAHAETARTPDTRPTTTRFIVIPFCSWSMVSV